jgi:excisionase family DNA binding protein
MPDLVPKPVRRVRPQPATVEKLLYSKEEAAYALGLSKRSIDYLISGRKLETRRIGSRVLIPADSLHKFARANHFDSVAS